MPRALGDVADAGVSEHVGKVLLGVHLEEQFHPLSTVGAVVVLDPLHPQRPAKQLFSAQREPLVTASRIGMDP